MNRSARLLVSSDKMPLEADLIWPADFIATIRKVLKEKSRDDIFYDKELKETALCLPYLAMWSYLTKEPCLIGKIKTENNPYDVILVPIKDIDRKNGKNLIHKHILLQVKAPLTRVITKLEDLRDEVQEAINKASKTQPSVSGVLYIVSTSLFSIRVSDGEIDGVLGQIKISKINSFSHIVFDLEFTSGENHYSEIWHLHPEFRPGFLIGKKEMQEIDKIYRKGTFQYMRYLGMLLSDVFHK